VRHVPIPLGEPPRARTDRCACNNYRLDKGAALVLKVKVVWTRRLLGALATRFRRTEARSVDRDEVEVGTSMPSMGRQEG